jgi:hypothetical protein
MAAVYSLTFIETRMSKIKIPNSFKPCGLQLISLLLVAIGNDFATMIISPGRSVNRYDYYWKRILGATVLRALRDK